MPNPLQVAMRAGVMPNGGGSAPNLNLRPVTSSIFRITSGAPHSVQFVTKAVNLLDAAASCIQTFALGQVSISAVVRDAQQSPVADYALPVDIRLCEAPLVAGQPPSCPAAGSALLGTVQVLPSNGVARFDNFSVTSISTTLVLSLYTPLLSTDYTEPFAACGTHPPDLQPTHQTS